MTGSFMINIVLVAPEIPQNTGNIIRLCSNVGANLHLIEPLGFSLDDASFRRASLDYGDLTNVVVHSSIDSFLKKVSKVNIDSLYGAVTNAPTSYIEPDYKSGDSILFGSENNGLSDNVVSKIPSENRVSIPMMPANRSINLSNAVAIILYEVWKQFGFKGSNKNGQSGRTYFS